MNQATLTLTQVEKVILDACSPFAVQINEHPGFFGELSVHFSTTLKIEKSELLKGEDSLHEVYGHFRNKVAATQSYMDMERNLLSQIKFAEAEVEALQKENARLQRFETYFNLAKEMKHGADAHAPEFD